MEVGQLTQVPYVRPAHYACDEGAHGRDAGVRVDDIGIPLSHLPDEPGQLPGAAHEAVKDNASRASL